MWNPPDPTLPACMSPLWMSWPIFYYPLPPEEIQSNVVALEMYHTIQQTEWWCYSNRLQVSTEEKAFLYGPSSSSNFLFRGIYFPFSEWKTWRKWVIKLGKYNRKPCDISFIPLSWDFLLFDLKIEWSNNQFFSHLLLIILFHGAGGVATWVTSPPPPLCCNRVLSRGVQRLLAVL